MLFGQDVSQLLSILLPPGIEVWVALVLIAVSFVTSAITAAFGLGGGAALIAVMSLVMPPAIVVPVHGAVQLGSNGGRAWLRRAHIQWSFVKWFVLGSAIGAFAGGQVVAAIPERVFLASIGCFILITLWAKLPPVRTRTPLTTIIAGAFSSAVGMLVGISGPLVITFLRNLQDRHQIVGTHAVLMTSQNTFKLLTFMFLGFAFNQYVILILAMVATGYAGTHFGSMLLDRMPERLFRVIFRIILTVIAIDLLRRAALG